MSNKFNINELEKSFKIVFRCKNYVLLVDGTVIKAGKNGVYVEVDKEKDNFAKEMYNSAHHFENTRGYQIKKNDEFER